ncbi:MAG: hypothetical protein ACXVXQ_11610 [Mycobacteriaceae bacterium]
MVRPTCLVLDVPAVAHAIRHAELRPDPEFTDHVDPLGGEHREINVQPTIVAEGDLTAVMSSRGSWATTSTRKGTACSSPPL